MNQKKREKNDVIEKKLTRTRMNCFMYVQRALLGESLKTDFTREWPVIQVV